MSLRAEYQLRLLREYIEKRDAAVIAAVRDGDINPIKQLLIDTTGMCPSDEVIWRTAHKMCCNITTMPDDLQEKSKQWLEERGSSPCIEDVY